MSIDVIKIKAFLSKLTLEQIYNSVFVVITLIIIVLAVFAIYRPVNSVQVDHIQQLSIQQKLPQTQDMAVALLEHELIYRGQYLKLMQAYQQESVRAHQLPAMQIENP